MGDRNTYFESLKGELIHHDLGFIIPIIGIIALLVAAGLAANVKKQSEGTDRMKEIAAAIHEGARAFLFR